jgi:hypothetical protein
MKVLSISTSIFRFIFGTKGRSTESEEDSLSCIGRLAEELKSEEDVEKEVEEGRVG